MRSRSPPRAGDQILFSGTNSPETCFTNLVGKLCVLELAFNLAPRDVHKSRGIWMVNQRAKKSVEVNLRKLDAHEKLDFERAMKAETDSWSTEAVRICEQAGIPKERIMNMRFVLTWKTVHGDDGTPQGKKAKARLIVRGFEDPGLLEVSRESPTLSTMGRNILLSECARQKFPVSVGDIKTAFLRGDDSELERDVYAQPPPEVKAHLGMSDTQLFRVVKAFTACCMHRRSGMSLLLVFLKNRAGFLMLWIRVYLS